MRGAWRGMGETELLSGLARSSPVRPPNCNLAQPGIAQRACVFMCEIVRIFYGVCCLCPERSVADSITPVYEGGGYIGAGYLMELLEPVTLATTADLFAALAALHAHGFAHGDAREPNIAATSNGELRWLDMRATSAATAGAAGAAARAADVEQLAASLLGVSTDELPVAVCAAAAAAAVRAPAAGYADVADAVDVSAPP